MRNIFQIISLMSILLVFGCTKVPQDAPNPAGDVKATPSVLKDNKDIISEGRKKNYNSTLEQYQSSNTGSQKLLNVLSSFDIAGLKLGMSKGDVVSSLEKYNKKFKFKLNNAKIDIPESHEHLNSINADFISREEFLEKYGEFFTIFFYQTPNKNLVSQIQREIKFERSEQRAFDAIFKEIKDKYGTPHTLTSSCKECYDCEVVWKHKYSSTLNNTYNIQYHKDFDIAESLFYPCNDVQIDKEKGVSFYNYEEFSCGNRLSVKIQSRWDDKLMLQVVDSITFNYYDELNLRLAAEYTKNFINTVKRLNTDLESDLLKGKIGKPPVKW